MTRTEGLSSRGALFEGSIRLSNGRSVDYCGIGPADSPVVLYCHGTPGSRLELLLARPALERNRLPIRLIALNRPGYGRSSFSPVRGFLLWADIVDETADRLGIDRFAVLGASGGSPFALACAYSLPDRIDRVAIVAGIAPPDTPGMSQAAALSDEYVSGVIRSLRYGSLWFGSRVGLAGLLTRRLIAGLGPSDRQALGDPRARDSLERVVREAFAQGGRAAVAESGLFMRPWDFDPASVTQQVHFWHGMEDTRVPPDVAESFAGRIRRAECLLWPHEGHFSWAMSDKISSITNFLATAST